MLDYMAGILDGEATLDLNNKKSIRIRISNSDMRLHDWLEKEFRGKAYDKKVKGNRKPQKSWELNGKTVYKLLKKVGTDRLLIKKEQADLLIEFYDNITRWGYTTMRPKPASKVKLGDEIYEKLKVLNQRGADKKGILRNEDEIGIQNKWAYLGGAIDGEGTISLIKETEQGSDIYRHNIEVNNTDPRMTSWLLNKFGGKMRSRESRKRNWAKTYLWRVRSEEAYEIMKNVRDYLVLDKEQCDISIELYEKVTSRFYMKKNVPGWVVRMREDTFNKLAELNKRGKEDDDEELELVEKVDTQKGLEGWM